MNEIINVTHELAITRVERTLAADYGCKEDDFSSDGNFFYVAPVTGSRAFKRPEKFLAVISMGKGTIISCTSDRLRWARANLASISSDRFFSGPAIAKMQTYVAHTGQFMAGPDLKYICTRDNYRPFKSVIDIELIEKEAVLKLYPDNKFPNALGHTYNLERPTMIVSLARHHRKVVGMAAASADNDIMWQVGVDILSDYRGKGIGKALVSHLTERIIERGKLPYYSTWVSNIGSQRTARSVGYKPVWVELYSVNRPIL
jgi:ribosomal protein S18 acetylase RimI-like enzyme